VGAERDEVRKAERRLGAAGLHRIEQEPDAILGQERSAVAEDEPFAELGHRLDVTALRRDRELVDRVAVAPGRIVLRGKCYSGRHD
jgi:hypothetical protein